MKRGTRSRASGTSACTAPLLRRVAAAGNSRATADGHAGRPPFPLPATRSGISLLMLGSALLRLRRGPRRLSKAGSGRRRDPKTVLASYLQVTSHDEPAAPEAIGGTK